MTNFTSNQNLADIERIKASFPDIGEAGADDYYSKTVEILKIIRECGPIFGSGSPEGVVTSTLCRQYVDTDTNTLYVNPDYGVSTGWVSV